MAKRSNPTWFSPRACSPFLTRAKGSRKTASKLAGYTNSATIEPLDPRRLLSATLNPSFGSNGQLIGSANKSGTTDILIPYADTGIFQFTGGNTVTRMLANGQPDTRFGSKGTLKLTTTHPIEALAAAPDGGFYVEYGVSASGSTTVSDIGIQHFTKTGRLDRGFGSRRLLDLANYNRSGTFAPGPIVVADNGRVYFESGGTLYFIPGNGSVAGIRKTDAHSTGSRIVLRSDGDIFILGSGVTAYDENFQRISLYGENGIALAGQTVTEGAFDTSNRLVLTVAGSSATAAPSLVRLNTRGTPDATFGTAGSVALPTSFLSAGTAFNSSHLLVRSDDSILVSGGVTTTTGTTSTQSAALLAYTKRGRLMDKLFSSNSNGVLSSSNGTLEGAEVDIAAGPHDSVYLSTLVVRNDGAFDFIEQFALKPLGGVL